MTTKLYKLETIIFKNSPNKVWNEISKLPFGSSSLDIVNNVGIITVSDNIYANEINMLKKIYLEKIKKFYPNVETLEVKIKKSKTIKSVIIKNNKEEINQKQIFERIKKENENKFLNIEDKTEREYLLTLFCISKTKEEINKLQKLVKCDKCGEYNKSKFCIICFNEKKEKEIKIIKKILLKEYKYSLNYATKIDGYMKISYENARDEILKNKYLIFHNSNKDEDLEEYVRYLVQTDNQIVIDIKKREILEDLKKMNINQKG